jgi:Mg-chelatase subunit ChlD
VSFLAPAAFALALLLPIIVAMYLLKLRRTEQVVSSVYLWRRMVRDLEANAPWQRLRRNLLLLLQLLFLAALVLALARPFTWTAGAAGQALILVLDTSASMAATDRPPSRIEAAKTRARQLVDSLPGDARVTVVAAGDGARVLVASSQDRRQVYQALDGLRAGTGGSDLTAALELASAVAARQPDAEIAILSDGRVTLPGRLVSTARVRYLPVGTTGDNQAIGLLSLAPAPGGERLSAFAQVVNYAGAPARRRLVLYADGRVFNAYDLDLAPHGQQAIVADDLPPGTRRVEARLTPGDALALDDRAWAVHRAADPVPVTLIGEGNLFLETALALLPDLQVTAVKPTDWQPESEDQPSGSSTTAPAHLTIFDAYVPLTATATAETAGPPPGNLFFVAPPRSTAYFSVTGVVEAPRPRPAEPDDPLLAHVDLGGVSVLEAARIPLPDWARPVVSADAENGPVPLLFAGEVDGRRVAVLAFDLHRSDLPLQVAFPLLLSNLASWLAPGSGGLPTQVTPGAAVNLSLPPAVDAAVVTRPDGSALRLVPEGGRATFADTAQLGVYGVSWSGTETETGTETASFAVNLFAPQESDIEPAGTLPLAGTAVAGDDAQAQQARCEWWRPLAWAALVLLVAEWLVYHRGALSGLKRRWQDRRQSRQRGHDPSWASFHSSRLPALLPFSFVRPGLLWLLLLVPLLVAVALLGRRRATRAAGRARFWAGLALRILLLSFLVLALAGTQVHRRADVLTSVFVLDVSDSVPPAERARGEAFLRQAIGGMARSDRAAIVLFGRDALVERLASGVRTLPDLASVPVTTRTDVAGALQLALALFPDEGARRLVLLSDGRENVGHALDQAEFAAARDVQLVYVPLGGSGAGVEALVEALDAPAAVRQGQDFDLAVVVHSTAPGAADLRVFADGQLIHSRPVHLGQGLSRFQVPVEAGGQAGFRRFRAQIVPEADTRLQNNEASAFTVVHGPPRVLVVEGGAREGTNLVPALRAAGMDVVTLAPGELPATLPELATYDAVVLANVPAAALPAGAMETLPVYVRDLGRGLLMTGGEDAFGAGGYLRTPLEAALPVDMDVRTREQSPNLALVLAVDKSGSMGRCHCDNPDLNQNYTRREVGQPKVDIAKEAVMRAAGALGRLDYLGVVAFDDAARWAVDVQPLPDPSTLERSIGTIQAVGGTDLRTGVEAAYQALQTTDARIKHVILLTDGWVRTGELTALAQEMRDGGITLSVVAAGSGAAEYLAGLAEQGGGRYYPAEDVLHVPDFFLKETIQAVGRYVVEEPFYPLPAATGPVLGGLDPTALPLLHGYNGTTPKSTARLLLATPRGDPLLATWQYGLGRAAVWTSDLTGRWASDWLAWDGFARFAAQLVSWTLPPPRVEGIVASASLEADRAAIRVEATDDAGHPRNFLDVSATLVDPELDRTDATLDQVGAGQYEALVEVPRPGTYLLQIDVRDGSQALGRQTLGLVVPYSPEYRAEGVDRPFLAELAHLTGGGELSEPAAAFLRDLPAAGRASEVWPPLLLAAALLFPLDVALRRVILGPRDLRKAFAWLRARLPATASQARRTERALGRLFQARDRARERGTRPTAAPSPPPRPAEMPPPAAGNPPPGPSSPGTSQQDALARLREAKERARRGH